MKVDTDDLVIASDIAILANVSAAAVSNWAARYDDFPAPVFHSNRVTLWRWSDVRDWLRKTDRAEVEGTLTRCIHDKDGEPCAKPFLVRGEIQDFCPEHRTRTKAA